MISVDYLPTGSSVTMKDGAWSGALTDLPVAPEGPPQVYLAQRQTGRLGELVQHTGSHQRQSLVGQPAPVQTTRSDSYSA